MLEKYTEAILQTPIALPHPFRAGQSRGGRPIPAFEFGSGPVRISLIAGCHADEPTGPRLLRKLSSFFSGLTSDHPITSKLLLAYRSTCKSGRRGHQS